MSVVIADTPQKIASDLLDAYNAHDIDRAVGFYSPEYKGVDISQASPHIGREGIRKFLSYYFQAFPDFQIQTEETISQGNQVVLIWSALGTHQGKLLNIPATGKKIKTRGVTVFTVENNQVKQALYFWDVAGVLREIGLLPEL